ncbi:hypothetical protein [Mycobacterium paraseoulense]|uniref:Uncharacterized protein n=1 Tax=Mycobacterium paraseoulense TaxID=590652 RepID=A0A1X0IEU7_9MYCO|nr:hypothetical protein [Mycobacterium paraseoulense]MCV7393897.1 hypothetical protein [Mycobacterium paraseoulense]ORB45382.1 hypothetical protein BST39_03905 [Mycobacterium paraseoulense]BBZ70476.1 hypothetical protein MPRS_15690 [Mycobacterium paraseoulense]
MPVRLDRAPDLRDNAYVALFLASNESAYMSSRVLHSADGGQFVRTSIMFPAGLGQSEDITAGALPDDLRETIDR